MPMDKRTRESEKVFDLWVSVYASRGTLVVEDATVPLDLVLKKKHVTEAKRGGGSRHRGQQMPARQVTCLTEDGKKRKVGSKKPANPEGGV